MGWVPTGIKSKNTSLSTIRLKQGLKYMFLSDISITTIIIVGTILRINDGYPYYNFLYIVLQSAYQFFLSFDIILYFLNI